MCAQIRTLSPEAAGKPSRPSKTGSVPVSIPRPRFDTPIPTAPKLARWLEEDVPESLTVFTLPAEHRKKMRTTNGIERPIQQELKRRTRNVRVFPNTDALLRLASAILVEIDDEWNTATKRYITWQEQMDR